MSGKELDQLFRDKLERAEVAPPTGAWNKVSAQIQPSENKRFYWGIAAGIAVVFAAGLIIGLQMGREQPIPDGVALIESNVVRELDEIIPVPPNTENKGAQTQPAIVVHENTAGESGKVNVGRTSRNHSEQLPEKVALAVNNEVPESENDPSVSLAQDGMLEEVEILDPEISVPEENVVVLPGNIKPSVAEEKTEPRVEERGSTIKKVLAIARDFKTDNNSWGALREAKDELLVLPKKKNEGSDD